MIDYEWKKAVCAASVQPLCIDCVHHVNTHVGNECHRDAERQLNPVTGLGAGPRYLCHTQRKMPNIFQWMLNRCGPNARYFVDKQPQVIKKRGPGRPKNGTDK